MSQYVPHSYKAMADEIDEIGSQLVLHYGSLPKDIPPGPPLALVTRLCKVRDALRSSGPVEQDAARYRWLRENDMTEEYSDYWMDRLNERPRDSLDDTIDAAMCRATREEG